MQSPSGTGHVNVSTIAPVSSNSRVATRLRGPEAAEYLGFSESYLSKLRVFGDGPRYIKAGKIVLYDTRDLEAWLEARKRGNTSEAD